MRILVMMVAVVGLLGLASCSTSKTYRGPAVTRVIVLKEERKLFLMHGNTAIKSYDVELGFAPEGDKSFEGDGRTPEGRYYIDRRNPNSLFHRSLGISYPNPQDRAIASSKGRSAGGDIFIHGGRRPIDPKGPDWTAGCIAVENREIETIYAMVRTGTPIDIYP
ncbi:L,D-transpeptidase family protein [Aliiroseovarius subalbicans]|uniref:L,D-transpeptidase family protein n=1 Tax=Aliiroseovarius subalbicans TaxID=2925840 RepID=UPI001F567CC3|nr:L,D-transpeptidase family protein [Aliiroseovarius subalbicans]MCI2400038.1 L,D-transpeptidase family protein [Aliiroseovarius subalbicans]